MIKKKIHKEKKILFFIFHFFRFKKNKHNKKKFLRDIKMNSGLIFHIHKHTWYCFSYTNYVIECGFLQYDHIIEILSNFLQSTNDKKYDCLPYIQTQFRNQNCDYDDIDGDDEIIDKSLCEISYKLIKVLFKFKIDEKWISWLHIDDPNTTFEQNLETICENLPEIIVTTIRENKTKYLDLLISLYMKSISYEDVYCHDTETILYKLGLQNVIADRELKNHAWDRSCSFIDDMDFSSEVWSHCYQKGYSISASIASRKYDKLYE